MQLGIARRGEVLPTGGILIALAAASFARAAVDPVTPELDAPDVAGAWCVQGALHGKEYGTLEPRPGETIELGAGWVEEGERIRVLETADRSRTARGPGEIDESDARGMRTPLPDEIVRLAPSTRAANPFTRLRRALARACDRAGGPENGPLLRALVCGDTSRFDAETLDLFTRTGTRHLLAVSGQHVTWIAAFALQPLSRALGGLLAWILPGRFGALRELLFLAAVLVYVPIAGGASPVRRAAVAFVLATAAGALVRNSRGGRRVDTLSLWSFALLAEVTLAPRAIGEVALLLSYAATLGLLLAAAPLARLFVGPKRFELAEHWHTAFARRVRQTVALALGASCAAVLATLPISWSVFGEFSVPGALITVAAVPLFACLLFGGWIWVCIPSWNLAPPFVAVAKALLALFAFGDRLPGTPLVLPPRPGWLLFAATAATFAALAHRGVAARRARLAALAAAAWAALLAPWVAAPRGLEVVAFDVGHGTAVALRAPGGETWLFDAGSRDRTRVAQAAVVPTLAAWDTGSLGIVASHDDRDHVSALSWIAERFRPRVWAGALDPAPRATALAVGALDLGVGRLRLSTSGPLRLDLVRAYDGPGNLGSRSLRAEVGESAVLLCGDAEGSALALQSASETFRGPVDVLLAPHHGSETEGLGALLARTRPTEVWISESRPAPILAELARRGLLVRQTCATGALTFDSTASGP